MAQALDPSRHRWGRGEQAVLDYLARYVFRIALTNARIVGLDDETVTIQYKERKTDRARTCRLSGEEFMRRFLQHVLPRGFHKVRYSVCGILNEHLIFYVIVRWRQCDGEGRDAAIFCIFFSRLALYLFRGVSGEAGRIPFRLRWVSF